MPISRSLEGDGVIALDYFVHSWEIVFPNKLNVWTMSHMFLSHFWKVSRLSASPKFHSVIYLWACIIPQKEPLDFPSCMSSTCSFLVHNASWGYPYAETSLPAREPSFLYLWVAHLTWDWLLCVWPISKNLSFPTLWSFMISNLQGTHTTSSC